MLLFNHFYLLVILYKVFEVSIVIVDDFHLISSLVQSINIGSKLLLQGLDVCGAITEILHRNSIADRIDNCRISLEFLDGSFVEGSPMEVEDDHDQQSNNIGKGHYHPGLPIAF